MRVAERCRRVLIVAGVEQTLLDAAIWMRRYDVGALPVFGGGGLVGILTERDVVAAVAEGTDPATATVGDHMTAQPVTVAPEEEVGVAAQRMAEAGVRHLPVVDGGRLVGVLSMRDLLAPAAVALQG